MEVTTYITSEIYSCADCSIHAIFSMYSVAVSRIKSFHLMLANNVHIHTTCMY